MMSLVKRRFSLRRMHDRPQRRSRLLHVERLEDRSLLAGADSVQALDPMAINSNTGEKPQSKVWTHADQWWTVLSDSTGTGVWRLDGTAWSKVLNLASGTFKADVKPAGNLAHILLVKDSRTKLVTVQHVAGSPGTYQLWSQQPQVVGVPLHSATETATIDVDSTGRLWVAFDTLTEVQVINSAFPYTSWNSPITLAGNITDDDITAITAMPGNKIGVLWSNQTTQRFGFRVHDDAAPPDQWSADEVPASQSALNFGQGMADDHLSIAVTSSGTLYAAIKTSYNTAGQTMLGLLVRRAGGTWDDLYRVDTVGTRPIVDVSEEQNRLLVIYRNSESAGPIVYKHSLLSTVSFSGPTTLIADTSMSNPSSLKGLFTDELIVIASGNGLLGGVRMTFLPTSNQPPQVNAGLDQTTTLSSSLPLDGNVSDDGLPDPPGSHTNVWSVSSGPGVVTFADSTAVDTTATFSQAGQYVLRLTATDSALSAFDEVVVNVLADSQVTKTFQDGVSPTAAYAGTTDTRLRKSAPTTNYGANGTIPVDASPQSAALIRWNISTIPSGSSVVSAKITVTVTDISAHSFQIYEVLRPWVEGQANWNQAASGAPWQTAGAAGGADRGSAVIGLASAAATGSQTCTLHAAGLAAIQAWIDDPSRNQGIIIQNYTSATDSLAFRSSEGSKLLRPKLEITYVLASQGGEGQASTATTPTADLAKRDFVLSSNVSFQSADTSNSLGPMPSAGKHGLSVSSARSPVPNSPSEAPAVAWSIELRRSGSKSPRHSPVVDPLAIDQLLATNSFVLPTILQSHQVPR